METIEKYFLWLMFYSIIGWIYETIVCSIHMRKFVNRGFLNGPYCPIYGSGALLDILLLRKIKNPILLFLCGGILNCTLEYLTSYTLEKLYHARWWDYSDKKFNLNGRIYLLGFVGFGAFSVLLMFALHPAVESITEKIPLEVIHILAAVLFAVFLTDNIITFCGMTGFKKRLEEFKEHIKQTHEIGRPELLSSVIEKFSGQQKRMLKVFPKLKESFWKLHDGKKQK